MVPYEFEYARAGSVDEALSLLAEHGDAAKVLAGGHSLIPAMKLRLAAPSVLVDLSGIDALKAITDEGDAVRVGALVTHRAVETSDVLWEKCPALAETAASIGDPQVRNRGTIGGSLAHADPAADYPALVLALDATINVQGASGSRTIAADDFFEDLFETALEEDELITSVVFPAIQPGTGGSYAKFPNPASGFAVVGVAVRVTVGDDGTCTEARIGVTGAAAAAFRATEMEDALVGQPLDEATITAAVAHTPDPAGLMNDLSASAEYRAHLCSVMAGRALRKAAEQVA